jgi:hypothetical protein
MTLFFRAESRRSQSQLPESKRPPRRERVGSSEEGLDGWVYAMLCGEKCPGLSLLRALS